MVSRVGLQVVNLMKFTSTKPLGKDFRAGPVFDTDSELRNVACRFNSINRQQTLCNRRIKLAAPGIQDG